MVQPQSVQVTVTPLVCDATTICRGGEQGHHVIIGPRLAPHFGHTHAKLMLISLFVSHWLAKEFSGARGTALGLRDRERGLCRMLSRA